MECKPLRRREGEKERGKERGGREGRREGDWEGGNEGGRREREEREGGEGGRRERVERRERRVKIEIARSVREVITLDNRANHCRVDTVSILVMGR